MSARQSIHCTGCRADVEARLTSGAEIYPHRADLADLPFWRCDACGNYVGCHHKTEDRTRPLGVIPTPELREARGKLHGLIDPLWKSGEMSRKRIYRAIATYLGLSEFHTADLRTIEDAREAYRAALEVKRGLEHNSGGKA